MVLESLIEPLILNSAKKYIANLDISALRLSIFGGDVVLQNLELKDRAPSFALTYVDILSLARDSFYRILDSPTFARERGIVRRACAYMSFRLGVLRITRMIREGDARAVEFNEGAPGKGQVGCNVGAKGGACLCTPASGTLVV